MVVVGTGIYKDKNEAFPLDRKTLNKIALRSFFASAAYNAETASSIGWAWAMQPGLEKIHTNEEDRALSMGHNLEFVTAVSPLSTVAMGVTLALEQQKADLETIRSVRTAVSAAADGLGESVFRWILAPALAGIVMGTAKTGSVMGAVIFAVVLALITVVLQVSMLYYGYSKGTRAAETLTRRSEALKHAARIAGLFMIGALVILYSSGFGIKVSSFYPAGMFRGFIPLLVTWMCYHLLTKKNWSIGKCALLIAVIGMLCGLLTLTGISLW